MKQTLLNSIKIGMKGEMDSINLYQKAAEESTSEEVKKFFLERAEEEKRHYNFLLEYYKIISDDKEMKDVTSEINEMGESPAVSTEFIKRIGKNQILFSSISTAVLLEKNAMEFYKKSAEESKDNLILSNFYHKMAMWEEQHYNEVLNIQKEAEEFYWNENKFQPF